MWLSETVDSLHATVEELSPALVQGWHSRIPHESTGNKLMDLILQATASRDDALRIARALDHITVGLKDTDGTPVLVINISEDHHMCTGFGYRPQPSDYMREERWCLFRAHGGLQMTGSCLPECRIAVATSGGYIQEVSGRPAEFKPAGEFTLYDVYNVYSRFYLELLDKPAEYTNPIHSMMQPEYNPEVYPVVIDCDWQVLVGDDIGVWLESRIQHGVDVLGYDRKRYERLLAALDQAVAEMPAATLF